MTPQQPLRTQVQATDGTPLCTYTWAPRSAIRLGRILIVHGLGEHALRYTRLAQHLTRQGWAVHAYDHRGHGHSAGPLGVVPNPDSLTHDLHTVLGQLPPDPSDQPLILLGHSLGGLVAAHWVSTHAQAPSALPADATALPGTHTPEAPAQSLPAPNPATPGPRIDGLVLSSPALRMDMNGVQRWLLHTLSRWAPHLAVGNGLRPADISRDPEVVRRYRSDPLVHDRICALLVQGMLRAQTLVMDRAAHWPVPTLLMWGEADRCVNPQGSRDWAARANPTQVHAHPFAGHFHEIFNEPEHAAVDAQLDAWLGRRVGEGNTSAPMAPAAAI